MAHRNTIASDTESRETPEETRNRLEKRVREVFYCAFSYRRRKIVGQTEQEFTFGYIVVALLFKHTCT